VLRVLRRHVSSIEQSKQYSANSPNPKPFTTEDAEGAEAKTRFPRFWKVLRPASALRMWAEIRVRIYQGITSVAHSASSATSALKRFAECWLLIADC
jgi:hypothetical protein